MSLAMETLAQAAARLSAPLTGADAEFCGVSTDSRTVRSGELFVALSGPSFDGHDYVAAAAARGAAGALVARALDSALPQIRVPDGLDGLQRYAASWRSGFSLPLVGVTGSNGKTTVKQLLAAVLAPLGPVLATEGNLNNHIGVPLTLCRLRETHRAAVIEMGANHPGEIAQLAAIAAPNIGIVTQAGDAHLEGFGSRDGVAQAKGELFAALGETDVAVINADDPYLGLWLGLAAPARVLRFGFGEEADVRASDAQPYPAAAPTGTQFTLSAFGERVVVELPLPGRHNVANALAAAAAGLAAGLDLHQVATGLAQVQAPSGRLAWKAGRRGSRILDDSYNANPTSLQAGLDLLAQCAAPRWLVLGDMAELGEQADALHLRAGYAARELGIERLYALGRHARAAAVGFGAGARHFDDIDALVLALCDEIETGASVLVKGSRSARMERVVAALAESADNGGRV